jgi:hypothetical protein
MKETYELIPQEMFDIDLMMGDGLVADACGELAGSVAHAWRLWSALDLASAAEPATERRRWLPVVNALLRSEAELERDLCRCPTCRASRVLAAELRVRLERPALELGLPLPSSGEEMRLPINVEVLERRAYRLLAGGAVTPLGRGQYLVRGGGGEYRIQAGRPEHWETDWQCDCPWSFPYPPDLRPGRGCSHVRAVRLFRAAMRHQWVPEPATMRLPAPGPR